MKFSLSIIIIMCLSILTSGQEKGLPIDINGVWYPYNYTYLNIIGNDEEVVDSLMKMTITIDSFKSQIFGESYDYPNIKISKEPTQRYLIKHYPKDYDLFGIRTDSIYVISFRSTYKSFNDPDRVRVKEDELFYDGRIMYAVPNSTIFRLSRRHRSINRTSR